MVYTRTAVAVSAGARLSSARLQIVRHVVACDADAADTSTRRSNTCRSVGRPRPKVHTKFLYRSIAAALFGMHTARDAAGVDRRT